MPDQDWKALAKSLSEGALLLKLKSTEHDFVERKPLKQKGDWLQTAVAFANSTPIGWPAVLFVGVDDNGKPQCQHDQLEDLSRSLSDTIQRAYPPIYRHVVPLDIPGEGSCLAVIIPGSPLRPHFAGQSYVRLGDQTKLASESQFNELIAQRNSKARMILEWVGKEITWTYMRPSPHLTRGYNATTPASEVTVVLGCNLHFFTVQVTVKDGTMSTQSYPLGRIELGFDNKADRLQIYYYTDR